MSDANLETIEAACLETMRREGVEEPHQRAFLGAVRRVYGGDIGVMSEDGLEPISELPRLSDFPEIPLQREVELLSGLAVIKLNGGLGTGMGLDRAKSLMVVKDPSTFLDFIARQVLRMRSRTGTKTPAFLLMNSFSTQADTLRFLERYPELGRGERIDFLQSKVPKLDAASFLPVKWPVDRALEWCPPGHGDIYPTLHASGLIDELLGRGIRTLFVSNSDNLGASVDLRLMAHLETSGLAFVMEVAERTESDRKGGHLARRRRDGRLVLRESAQTGEADKPFFEDIRRHRFFNTNNLWIGLQALKSLLERSEGFVPLPLIRNLKTVDPKDDRSPKVLQLESAMGAAIECFERSGAVVVPRDRFAPVKSTADLLALRSDAYVETDDCRLVLSAERRGVPPVIELDPRYYKVVENFERFFPEGVPSLIGCERLKVTGRCRFEAGVRCSGQVEISASGDGIVEVPGGTYRDEHRVW